MKFSVIIPVYNTEKHLEECIQSVLIQSFTDFELILINDGSTDSSGTICEMYTSKDHRVKVFHTKNGGVSSARNLGIKYAIGEWIGFIDSDDFVDKTYLADFADNITVETDLIIQGMKKYDSESFILFEFEKKVVLETEEFLDKYKIIPYFFGPVSKVFRRQIVLNNNLDFDITKSYGEDTLFNLDYLLFCEKKIILVNKINYHYRRTANSLSTQQLNFIERLELFENLKIKLEKLTTNKDHFYWYSVELIRSLYYDRSVREKRKMLNYILSNNRQELLVPYQKNTLLSLVIKFLIMSNNIFLLSLLYRSAYR